MISADLTVIEPLDQLSYVSEIVKAAEEFLSERIPRIDKAHYKALLETMRRYDQEDWPELLKVLRRVNPHWRLSEPLTDC